LDLRSFTHWHEGIQLSNKAKREHWWPIFDDPRRYNSVNWNEVDFESIAVVLNDHGCDVDPKTIIQTTHKDLDTIGRWYYVKNPISAVQEIQKKIGDGTEKDWKQENIKIAHHASSIDTAAAIRREGLTVGPTSTGGHFGVFCEGPERTACCLRYLTHKNVTGLHPYLVIGCLHELLVDIGKKTNVHQQWCIKDPKSVIVTGTYIHVFDLADAYTPGKVGWYWIKEQTLQRLAQERTAFLAGSHGK